MVKIEKYAYARGYRVSVDGKIKGINGHFLSPRLVRGYYDVCIRDIGNHCHQCHLYIHRLQAYQKYGDDIYTPGIQVRHLNGDSQDNSFDNIAIGTSRDNQGDKTPDTRRRAAQIAASNNPQRYPLWLIQEIRSYRSEGATYRQIMERFKISSKGTVSYICNHNYDNPYYV